MKVFPTLPLVVLALPCLAQSPVGPDRFQLTAGLSFNAGARFGGIGGLPAGSNPGPATGGGLDRNYDDGYVRRDADGNAGGVTWNWGYREAGQIPGDDTLRLNSASSLANGTSTATQDEPAAGYQLAWLHELHRQDGWLAGFKFAFSYADYDFRDSGPVFTTALRLTDVYSLGGIVPPGDPNQPGYQYAGTADLPGPVIDDEPSHRETATLPGGALTTGTRQLDASLWAFKLGPWLEIPLCRRVSAQFGGGFALGLVDASFRFDESTTIAGAGAARQTGSDSEAAFLLGGYVEGQLNTHLTENLDFVFGAGLLALDSYQENLASRPVRLDFGTSWNLQAGFSLSF